MRLKVSDDTGRKRFWFQARLAAQMSQDVQRHEMRAEDYVRFEFPELADEFRSRELGQHPAGTGQLADQSRVVRFIKHTPPQFRGVLDDFDVALDVNLPVKPWGKVQDVELLYLVLRAQRFPRFLQSGGRLEMPGTCSDCGDQDSHAAVLRESPPKQK